MCDPVGAILDLGEDIVDLGGEIIALGEAAIEAVIDAVDYAWYEVVVPALEEVFSWLGIEDETVVLTQKISTLIFEDNDVDVVQRAKEKAAIEMTQIGGSYYDWYMINTRKTRSEFRQYYNFAKNGYYIHGLPKMEIKGGDSDDSGIDTSLDTDLGFSATRLTTSKAHPTKEVYFKNILQASPYNYKPWNNTLTESDPHGVGRNDYTFNSVVYNAGNNTYTINISRVAEEALFWIEGPVHIVEGDSATYTIKCNRTVPIGTSVSIDLAYTGTEAPTEYTPVSAVTITAGNTEVDFVVTTVENTDVQTSRTIIVTIDSIDNTPLAFEAVGIYAIDSVTTTITDDEGPILTMSSAVVTEAAGSITIPVKLENAFAVPFIVDYGMLDITAIGGLDYDNTPGTLSFAGTAGEIHNIVIPITSDSPDDNETFLVRFTSCDNPRVDYTQTALITITDGSDLPPAASTTVVTGTIVEPGYTSQQSLIVTYHANVDPASEWFYWIYEYSSNLYPDINELTNVIYELEMLPIGILRKDKVSINEDKGTQEYRTTRHLLNTVGLDIEEIISNVEESPDIDSVDDLFVNFAMCPSTDKEIISKLLWLSYYHIVVKEGLVSADSTYSATFREQDVQNAVVWTDHTYTPGVVGLMPNGGDYWHNIVYSTEEITDSEGNLKTVDTSHLVIYERTTIISHNVIKLKNLSGMASIEYNGFYKVALNKLGDENFTIPLSYGILNLLDPLEVMEAYQYILRIDVYALQTIELEWYQTSAFAHLFEFAMIVITIWTLGGASPFVVAAKLAVSYLVMQLVIYIAELTGNAELAALLGFVAMIAIGMYGGGGFSIDMASAEGLINASTQFANNLTTAYDTISEGFLDDLNQLNEDAQARLDEIDDVMPEESAISAEFLVALKSFDSNTYPAIKAQYDFNLIYNYDMIIQDYYTNNLRTGVI